LIRLSPEAEAQFGELVRYYKDLFRERAIENLVLALERAAHRIAANPLAGLKAPRPYPELKRSGRLWLKQGIYWISYRATEPPVITGVFHESVDIPRWVEK
jgi:plasmid stabilization system protein ParE